MSRAQSLPFVVTRFPPPIDTLDTLLTQFAKIRMPHPEPNDTWLVNIDGFGLEPGHQEDFYRGQVLEFALYAHTRFSIPSDEREIRHLLRADHTYDVNAKILCVTRSDGGLEDDIVISVLDFGIKAYTYERLHDGVFDSGNYWVGAKISLDLSRFTRFGRTVVPYASELSRNWRIENVYQCLQQTEHQRPVLQEVPEFRLAGPDPNEDDLVKAVTGAATLFLNCKDLGPAHPVPQ